MKRSSRPKTASFPQRRSRILNPTVLYPLIFQPIFKERVWGGREIEKLYGKKLPPANPSANRGKFPTGPATKA